MNENNVLFTFGVFIIKDIEFMLFYLDNVDETRCDNPTKTDVETCNDFGDDLCSSFGIVTPVGTAQLLPILLLQAVTLHYKGSMT